MKIKGIEFSEETIVGWAEQAGVLFEKPKFEPVTVCCLRVRVTDLNNVCIETMARYDNHCGCRHSIPGSTDRLIAALQKAKAFVEANKE